VTEDVVVPFIDGPSGEPRELVTRTYIRAAGLMTPYDGDEPTALAYTPDELMPTEPMPQWVIDALDRQSEDDTYVHTQVETVALAVESARRWAARRDLSPELRLRRMWAVLTVALNG
jgi:hypothetical protein